MGGTGSTHRGNDKWIQMLVKIVKGSGQLGDCVKTDLAAVHMLMAGPSGGML